MVTKTGRICDKELAKPKTFPKCNMLSVNYIHDTATAFQKRTMNGLASAYFSRRCS